MRTTALVIMLVLFVATAQAKIYRWVDKNGSVHFSDKPYAENAQEIEINETGIEMDETPDDEGQKQPVTTPPFPEKPRPAVKKTAINKDAADKQEAAGDKIITEADYKVTTTIGILGEDIVSISGRIGSGPECNDLSVTATAINDNGLSAKIRDQVKKSRSFGSVTYKGTAKAAGKRDEDVSGFWKIDSVEIRCND